METAAMQRAVAQAWEEQREWEAVKGGVPYDDATRVRAVCQRVALLLSENGLLVPEGCRHFPLELESAVREGRVRR